MTDDLKPQPARAAISSFIGTMIEWYDFFCYGTASALVFGKLFFSTDDPVLATLASLATYAAGFVSRPIGALIFGHIGDVIGRKKSLLITLTMMGTATTLIGFLPGYKSIGIWAPLLLIILRLIQGFAVGGEWGGAVLIATEHASDRWRTFLAAAPQYGSPVGLILSTLVFKAFATLPESSFLAWGWRLPFIFSSLLLIVAYWMRSGLRESPVIVELLTDKVIKAPAPIIEIMRHHKLSLAYGIGFCLLAVAGWQLVTAMMIPFTTQYLHIQKSVVLSVVALAGTVELICLPIGSYFAHRIGERKFLVIVTALATLWSAPMAWLIFTGSVSNLTIGISVATVLISMYYAVLAVYLPRAFPAEVRYTGISMSFQLCAAIFGGTTPLVGMWISSTYGPHWQIIAGLFAAISGGSCLCALMLQHSIKSNSSSASERALTALGRSTT